MARVIDSPLGALAASHAKVKSSGRFEMGAASRRSLMPDPRTHRRQPRHPLAIPIDSLTDGDRAVTVDSLVRSVRVHYRAISGCIGKSCLPLRRSGFAEWTLRDSGRVHGDHWRFGLGNSR